MLSLTLLASICVCVREDTLLAQSNQSSVKPSLRYQCFLLLAVILGLLLAGCDAAGGPVANAPTAAGAVTATPFTFPTEMPTPTDTPTPAPTATPAGCLPPSPAAKPVDTPIAAHGWTSYTDTALHYTLRYPATWVVPYSACPGGALDIYNYDPRDGVGGSVFPTGGIKIEVMSQDNPSQLSAQQFFQMTQQNAVGGPACPAYTTQAITIGGHDALQTTCPSIPSYGYDDYVPDGAKMLTIATGGVLDAQLSSIFQQMVASMTFTS